MNYTLKKSVFTLFVCAAVSMVSCLDKFVSANFDYTTETDIMINGLSTIGDHTFGSSVVTSGLKDELEKNNTSLDLLDELNLKSAEVTISGDSNSNFDAIEKVELYLSADGQPEVMIASKNPVPDGQTTLMLDVNNTENLANYIKSNTFTYTVKGRTSAPLHTSILKAKVVWAVKASAKD